VDDVTAGGRQQQQQALVSDMQNFTGEHLYWQHCRV
jgi:hypothetical protein